MMVDVLLHDGTAGPVGRPWRCREYAAGREPAEPPRGWQRITREELALLLSDTDAAYHQWLAEHPPEVGDGLSPLPRLAFISLIEDGLGLDYDALPALIDQHVTDEALARRIKRALRHGAVFDATDEPIDGVGAIRWLAQQLGVSDEQFVALWRAAGG